MEPPVVDNVTGGKELLLDRICLYCGACNGISAMREMALKASRLFLAGAEVSCKLGLGRL